MHGHTDDSRVAHGWQSHGAWQTHSAWQSHGAWQTHGRRMARGRRALTSKHTILIEKRDEIDANVSNDPAWMK